MGLEKTIKPLRQFIAGLIEGLFRPTPVSLFVVLLTVVWIVIGFTPQIFSLIPHEYFIRRPRVLDVQASQKALQLRFATANQLTVTLLGASSLHEALLGEDKMAQQLSSRLGRPVTLKKITVRGVKIFDLLRFVDQIPSAYKGIVLICVSTEKYEDPEKSLHRFPLASPSYTQEISKLGISPSFKTGVFLIDNYRFFTARSRIFAKALIFGPVRPVTYYGDGLKLSEQNPRKRRIVSKAKQLPQLYKKYSPRNFQTLSLLFSTLEEKGIYGIYLHPPRNLEFLLPLYESIDRSDYLSSIENDITKFAENSGITYWNLNDKRYFHYDDFRDSSHLTNTKARTRYSEMLLDKLYHLIQEQYQGEG